jgi:membrane-associated protease RseP (regulator of RpoE activity)
MSAFNFEPDSARCRLIARGAQRGFAFEAAGSQQFVASATVGAAIGYSFSSAIEKNQNYNDCMMARGWRIADGKPSSQDTAMDGHLVVPYATAAPLPPVSQELAQLIQPQVRRDLLVRAKAVTWDIADALRMSRKAEGVLITEVEPNGAAASAGLQPRDVILAFNGRQIHNLRDLQEFLNGVSPNTRIAAIVWRNRTEQKVDIQF